VSFPKIQIDKKVRKNIKTDIGPITENVKIEQIPKDANKPLIIQNLLDTILIHSNNIIGEIIIKNVLKKISP
tara:strand:- start:2132 stop:2347 length:216 start_codon:yes stop_codon:yes gene_type:complete